MRHFDGNKYVAELNAFRIQLGSVPGSELDFRNAFRAIGLPSNQIFWSEFKNSNLLSKIGKDLYCFTEPENPINYKKLDSIYAKYHKRAEQYKRTWISNKSGNSLFGRTDIIEAIELLTSNGFDVIMRANKLIK